MKEFDLKNYGLIGKFLGHSMSKYIHGDLWGYDYKLQNLNESELDYFLKEKNFKGLNVTIPYKEKVIKYLDKLNDLAEDIGAVNTIKNNNGKLEGYNTDYYGFDYMLKEANISYDDKKVLILGSGGASKMVQKYCKDKDAKEIIVISRTGENNYENLDKFKDFDAIVNASPVGMYPKNLESKIDIDLFTKLDSVVDLIYNPLKTKLLLDAESKNIKIASGLDMLVSQAFYSAEIFFDKKLDQAIIEKTCKLLEREIMNITFVGMPGSGKTRMASLLAKDLGKKLIDIDREIEKKEKLNIEDIFKYKGEKYFRKIESQVLLDFSKEKGQIISTGGGSILSEINRHAIRQNSFVMFLNRPVEKLSRRKRPLSKDLESLKNMYEKRISYYKEVSDIEIDVEESISKTYEKIKRELIKHEIISD